MRFHVIGTRAIQKMRLAVKLALAFFLMAAMTVGVGLAGLFFVHRIQTRVSMVSEVSTPLFTDANELAQIVGRAHIAFLEILNDVETAKVREQNQVIDGLDAGFRRKMEDLTLIVDRGKLPLDVGVLAEAQQNLFRYGRDLMAAVESRISLGAEEKAKLNEFELLRGELDLLLADFARRSGTAANQKEDRAKTLVQSGDATVEALQTIVNDFFEHDYMLVQGAAALQGYFMRLQDTSRAFIMESAPEKLTALSKELDTISGSVASRLKKLRPRMKTDVEKQDIQKLIDGFDKLKGIILSEEGLFRLHERLLEANASVEELQERVASANSRCSQASHELFAMAGTVNGEAHTAMEQVVGQAQTNIGLAIALVVLLGAFCTWLISRAITRPILRVVDSLRECATQVSSASVQLSAASQSLADGSSDQAAGLEETSSSLEEMASMTRQNAENAGFAKTSMTNTSTVVRETRESMTELTQSMEEISTASERTQKIVKTIDEIAFQTNLLALNAAVEAARAGEAGAGFAVVADEVRNLAMRAADAAKNTAGLIEGTVKSIRNASMLTRRAGEVFGEVEDGTDRVGELVMEISEASREQAQGIEQVNRTVAEMDRVVQQNAANAEESASASRQLEAQAERMKDFVTELIAVVGHVG